MAREATDIAAELLGTGLDQRQATLLTELILALSTRQGGTQVESPAGASAAEKRRAWDRAYRRERRERERMGDEPSTRYPPESTRLPPDKVDEHCNFLSSLSNQEGNREEKKESSSKIVALGNKGTRLSPDAKIANEDREFAWTLGFDDRAIDRMWAEFVDYWSAVPGHRGLKTRWSATWRNRVRAIHERKGNGANPRASKPAGAIAAAREMQRRFSGEPDSDPPFSLPAR